MRLEPRNSYPISNQTVDGQKRQGLVFLASGRILLGAWRFNISKGHVAAVDCIDGVSAGDGEEKVQSAVREADKDASMMAIGLRVALQ